jgi:ATP-dependent RNA helicase DDX5/DBP2
VEDEKIGKVDLDRSPSLQDDKSAPYSPVYNGKGRVSMSPNGHPVVDAKPVEVSEKPDPVSPPRRSKNREDEEEGIIDEEGEEGMIADDPRASAAVQNGDK